MSPLSLREHRFLGMTQSLCPECLAVVPAKIVSKAGRIYFQKHCPAHGLRDDFVCSDERWFDRMEYSLPGRVPARFAIEPLKGCPYDCGLCTEHEQHTCIAVFEITSSCNLTCPLCYASSAPGGVPLPLADCRRAIDRLVEYEIRPEVLQLSGGEPTIHPEFVEILDYACEQPIDLVMINTNGIRLAADRRLREELARRNRRCEVYLQFDGFDDAIHQRLRGERLLEQKLRAIELLGELDVRVTLVMTVETGVNVHEIGRVIRFGMERPWVTAVSFQPATYVGRHPPPADLHQRVTFPDVIREIVQQSDAAWRESDFLPLPCAHPNSHSIGYAYRDGLEWVPLARFIDAANHPDLLANGITFNRARVRSLISEFLARQNCGCGGDCGPVPLAVNQGNGNRARGRSSPGLPGAPTNGQRAPDGGPDTFAEGQVESLAARFFERCMTENISPSDVFRITTTSFMDAYNFDIRQLMKSCVHQLLPSGHLVPFCAYNVLYRDGHVPLPPLREAVATPRREHARL